MSRFIGITQGARGEASRLGHASSGIRAQAQGWDAGAKIYGSVDDQDRDVFQLVQTGGSNGATGDRELGRIIGGRLYLNRSAIAMAEIIEDGYALEAVDEVTRSAQAVA